MYAHQAVNYGGIYGKNQSLEKGQNFTGQKMTYKKTYFFDI